MIPRPVSAFASRPRSLTGLSWGLAAALWITGVAVAQAETPTYLEKEGIVAIEAEHPTLNAGAWEEVEGRTASEANQGLSPDFRVRVTRPDHPLAAGCSGEVGLPAGTWLAWAHPTRGAEVAVTLGQDGRRAVVFGCERGSRLEQGGTAPARRAFAPMPRRDVPELARWLAAAASWASGEAKPPRRALVITNHATLNRSEAEVVKALEAAGFDVETIAGEAATVAQAETYGLLVVPLHVRSEKVLGKFGRAAVPVLVLGKHDVAVELGLIPEPNAPRVGGNAMLIRAGRETDHLGYAVHFRQPGPYKVWLLGQSGGSTGSDEARVYLRGLADGEARPLTAQFGDALQWVPAQAAGSAHAGLTVERAGWHMLYVEKGPEPAHDGPPPRSYRYPNWRVDKVVLVASGQPVPSGDGPAETRNTGEVPVPGNLPPPREFRPAQIWPIREGFAVIEAEAIDHHPHWFESREIAGFTGSSFLEWRGPDRSVSIEGVGGNNDEDHTKQGAPEEWLIIRLWVKQPGTYRLDLRNHHRHEDGDNDVWFGRPDRRATAAKPIGRMGDSLKDGAGFSWLDWGVGTLECTAGINEFYIGGRSVGFGIDRIAVYAANDPVAKARALDLSTEATRPMPTQVD